MLDRNIFVAAGTAAVLAWHTPAQAQGKFYACSEEHAARQFTCNVVSRSRPTICNTIDEGACETCVRTEDPNASREVHAKATYTISIRVDAMCMKLRRKIAVEQLRCD
jgi:hypothetical protein